MAITPNLSHQARIATAGKPARGCGQPVMRRGIAPGPAHGAVCQRVSVSAAREQRDPALPGVAVDLHCHLLPGLDDGARDLDDAVAMARQAEADGIGAVCATPHIRHDHAVRVAELPERRAELAATLRAAGVSVRVLPGGEVATDSLRDLDDHELRALTLGGGGRWILLEPPAGPLDDRTDAAVEELRRRGLGAIVAHPERHARADLVSRLTGLVTAGALIQPTGGFLLQHDTRATMLELARHGLLHVLGSDAHSSRWGRPVALAEALRTLRCAETVAGHLEWIARTAPLAIVAGAELRPPFAPRP